MVPSCTNASAGFESVEDFAAAMMSKDEDKHLGAFVNFVGNNEKLVKALKDKDWKTFAKLYNGPGYKKNDYDSKLKDAYQSYLDQEKKQKEEEEKKKKQ